MNKIKQAKYAILSFFIPFCTLFLLYFFNCIITKRSFLVSDSLLQFFPTYKYLYNVLHGTETFPYTFSKGLGGTMYAAFFYGLSSPTNLLVYFFKNVELFMFISSLIKISLSGLTMYTFLRYKERSQKISLIFSLCYSLSSYMCQYSLNIMWLDDIALAPIVLIGVEKIIKEKKKLLYTVTVLYSLISNYYLGYIIMLFSVIYFIYILYINYEGKKFIKDNCKILFKFLFHNFFIGCSILFILIPTFIESFNFYRNQSNKIINFNFFDLISGTYFGYGNYNIAINYFSILIYFGVATIPLLLNYFNSKNVSKKEKKASFVVMLLFLLPVIFLPLSRIWHLFTIPHGFNYRYSFFTIIFMILLITKNVYDVEDKNKLIKFYNIIYIICSLSLIYSTYVAPGYYGYLNYKNIIPTIILLEIYIYLIKKKKIKLILILLPIELVINITFIFLQTDFIDIRRMKDQSNLINYEKQLTNENYKFENENFISFNDSLIFNYKGVNIFISSSNKRALGANFMLNFSNLENNNYEHKYSTLISDSILGIKYIASKSENEYYKLIDTYEINNEKIYLYENPYALPLAFISDKSIKELDTSNVSDIEFINNLINSINNKDEEYFKELEVDKIYDTKYIIKKNKKDNQIYIATNQNIMNLNIKQLYNHQKVKVIYDNESEEKEIELSSKPESFKAYTINTDKYSNFTESITKGNVIYNKGNEVEIEVDSDKDGVLFTKIIYEKGWNIYVDDKKVDYYEIMDSFIGLDISKGKHTIYMKYKTPYLIESIIISLISFIGLIIYTKIIKY